MNIGTEGIIALIGLVLGVMSSVVGYAVWLALTLNKMQHSIKYINTNLRLIDWEKVPKKNMNDII